MGLFDWDVDRQLFVQRPHDLRYDTSGQTWRGVLSDLLTWDMMPELFRTEMQ